MRRLSLLALAAASLGACQVRYADSPPAAPARTDGPDVFALVVGTWDWSRGDSTCLGNRHTIMFSGDRREMIVTFRQPVDSIGRREVRYRILQAGGTVLPNLPYVIRGAVVGETRRTDRGEPVVWDLILASPNRYHWHRTDWGELGLTGAVVRCDGTRPLEQWRPPAGGTTGASG